MRATDKISKKLSILKHHSGTVVGWQLHPSDSVHCETAARVLNYLPPIIFVKWDNKEWTLGSGWEPGVYPMRPIERAWEVNKATKAKVTRKSYQLFPDFAHTDHIFKV